MTHIIFRTLLKAKKINLAFSEWIWVNLGCYNDRFWSKMMVDEENRPKKNVFPHDFLKFSRSNQVLCSYIRKTEKLPCFINWQRLVGICLSWKIDWYVYTPWNALVGFPKSWFRKKNVLVYICNWNREPNILCINELINEK